MVYTTLDMQEEGMGQTHLPPLAALSLFRIDIEICAKVEIAERGREGSILSLSPRDAAI